jgi:uncharacterized iron-regulated membrane protein
MKKAIGTIHLWLGIASGLVVFIISVTGCIYVFEEELKTWAYKDRELIVAPKQAAKKPLSELLAIAQKEVGVDHPIQGIEVPGGDNQTYVFRPAQIRDNKAYTHFGEIVYYRKVYINPYTGAVVKNENTKYEFFTVVLRLHRNLLLNREIGLLIVGTSVLFFVILLISGIVLWWPKNKLAIKKSISFAWKRTTQWKRKNYDLHSVFGFYSSFVLIIIALTGLTWAFDWFDNSVRWLVNKGAKSEKVRPLFSDTTQVNALMPIDKILVELRTSNPDAHSITINLPEKPKGVINASARSGVHIRYTTMRYQYDQFTGELLKTANFGDKNTGEKLKAMTYDIHVGSILGLPGKFLAFFAALISASLPITGFFIWYGRRSKKKLNKGTLTLTRSLAKNPIQHSPFPSEVEVN